MVWLYQTNFTCGNLNPSPFLLGTTRNSNTFGTACTDHLKSKAFLQELLTLLTLFQCYRYLPVNPLSFLKKLLKIFHILIFYLSLKKQRPQNIAKLCIALTILVYKLFITEKRISSINNEKNLVIIAVHK